MDIRPVRKQPHSTAPLLPTFIPDELVAEILSRLDVKTIVRFKSVSKSWNTLISDPAFVDKHLKKSSQKQNLIVIWNISDGYNVSRISLHSLIENPSISIHSRNNSHFLKRGCYIAGSCNGLICLFSKSFYITQNVGSRHVWHENYSIYFWNPSTRKKSEKLGSFSYSTPVDRLYPFHSLSNSFQFGFGYDDSRKTYKVVAFHVEENKPAPVTSEVKVFSLGGNCWRNIQSFPVIPLNGLNHRHTCLNNGMHLSGTVNWLAGLNDFYSIHEYWYITNAEQFVIISLDLSTETYKQLLLPPGYDEVPTVWPVLMVLMECLCFSYDTKDNGFVLWQMKEYGVQESWSQLFKISYHNLQDCCVKDYDQMVCLYKNGDIVIFAKPHKPDQAVIYNLRNKKVARIRVQDCIDWSFHASVYIESLVEFR